MCRDWNWVTDDECVPAPNTQDPRPSQAPGRTALVGAANVTPAPATTPVDSVFDDVGEALSVTPKEVLPTAPSLAQAAPQASARNSVYLELLGNGSVYSVNFEREILPHLGLRVDAATWGSEGEGVFSSTSVGGSIGYAF
jgi:hypothetical protein